MFIYLYFNDYKLLRYLADLCLPTELNVFYQTKFKM